MSHETLAVIDTTVLMAVADHPPPPTAMPEPAPKAPSLEPAAKPVSKLSPAVRKLVAEHAIDPARLLLDL